MGAFLHRRASASLRQSSKSFYSMERATTASAVGMPGPAVQTAFSILSNGCELVPAAHRMYILNYHFRLIDYCFTEQCISIHELSHFRRSIMLR